MEYSYSPSNLSESKLLKNPKIKATIFDRRGKVLSIGYNSYEKTSPIQAKYSKLANLPGRVYLHAEISAIIKAKHGIPYKILVERYDKNGNPKDAAPCKICMLAIKESGIERIEFTIG